jgi:hypothetical protein
MVVLAPPVLPPLVGVGAAVVAAAVVGAAVVAAPLLLLLLSLPHAARAIAPATPTATASLILTS